MSNNTSKHPEYIVAMFLVGMCIFLMYLAYKALESNNVKAASFYVATVIGTFFTVVLSAASETAPITVETKNTVEPEPPPKQNPEPIQPQYKPAIQYQKPNNKGYVYLVKALHDETLFKIGRTNNPKNRLRTFEIKLPFAIEYECLIQTDDMHKLERELHLKFKSQRLQGEFFRLSPDDVQYIKDLAS